MGTTVSVLVPEHAMDAADAVRTLFAAWEQTLSRFRPDSELTYLNRHAGHPVAVSPLLFGAIAMALDAARATDGLYDPTLLHHMALLGYDRSFETLPPHVPPAARRPDAGGGWRAIHLDWAEQRVTLPPGTGIDLGGIAKGMAVDAALERLRSLGVEVALVSAGGDLAVHGLPPGQPDWPIAVATRDGHLSVPLHHGAMATSGVARRHWLQGSQTRHHLLNPRTGLPADSGLWSVSVVAARCAQAEVAATAAFVLGPDEGVRFLDRRGLAGLLIVEAGGCRPVGLWPRAVMEVSA